MKTDCVGGLMETAMENIKNMVEVNTIIGDAVETPNGTVIIPVSKMCCGFASGGTHMVWDKTADEGQHPPFGGGAGAGVSVQPVGFLLVGDHEQYAYPFYSNYQPDHLERMETMIRSLAEHGYESTYFTETLLK